MIVHPRPIPDVASQTLLDGGHFSAALFGALRGVFRPESLFLAAHTVLYLRVPCGARFDYVLRCGRFIPSLENAPNTRASAPAVRSSHNHADLSTSSAAHWYPFRTLKDTNTSAPLLTPFRDDMIQQRYCRILSCFASFSVGERSCVAFTAGTREMHAVVQTLFGSLFQSEAEKGQDGHR